MKLFVAQFIPIVLIFLFLTNNNIFVQFSQTTLGRMMAVALIVFYAAIDKYVGLFACAIIIFYYQNNYIEAMDIMDIVEIDEIEPTNSEDVDDGNYVFMEKKGTKIDVIDKKKLVLVEPTFSGSEDEFRKQNCERGVLKYKNMKVKNEMADIVFPQMKFKGAVCNPCNKTCDISVS